MLRGFPRRSVVHVSLLLGARLLLGGLGFVPISCLSLALIGVVPLYVSAPLLVLPATMLALALGLALPGLGRQALGGLVAGMGATLVYDLLRLIFVLTGIWSDFIPQIGAMLHASPALPWGYLWRYLYDGGAMGMTFALLPWRDLISGLLYGLAICACLFATLLLAPLSLFPLNLSTIIGALLGHLIYGSTLAWLLQTQSVRLHAWSGKDSTHDRLIHS